MFKPLEFPPPPPPPFPMVERAAFQSVSSQLGLKIGEIAELTARIDSLRDTIAPQDQEILRLDESAAAADRRIKSLEKDVHVRDLAIRSLNEQLTAAYRAMTPRIGEIPRSIYVHPHVPLMTYQHKVNVRTHEVSFIIGDEMAGYDGYIEHVARDMAEEMTKGLEKSIAAAISAEFKASEQHRKSYR